MSLSIFGYRIDETDARFAVEIRNYFRNHSGRWSAQAAHEVLRCGLANDSAIKPIGGAIQLDGGKRIVGASVAFEIAGRPQFSIELQHHAKRRTRNDPVTSPMMGAAQHCIRKKDRDFAEHLVIAPSMERGSLRHESSIDVCEHLKRADGRQASKNLDAGLTAAFEQLFGPTPYDVWRFDRPAIADLMARWESYLQELRAPRVGAGSHSCEAPGAPSHGNVEINLFRPSLF